MRDHHKKWLRLLGLILLAFLLTRVDTSRIFQVFGRISLPLFVFAILLNVPQIAVKAYRWKYLLSLHGIRYSMSASMLSYFGSIFIGLLTPGRLGEFVKALHVNRDCNVPVARAFASVLVDRLFDLCALMLVGGAALLATFQGTKAIVLLLESALVLAIPLTLLLHDRSFEWISSKLNRMGKFGARLVARESWLVELRSYLKGLRITAVMFAAGLTGISYLLFFYQCFLLARALNWELPFLQISFAVALGSLVTLIPISISGLGTREATIVSYLGTAGIVAEEALSFSLLIFVVFYVFGALMGAVAWIVKPVAFKQEPAP